MSRPRLFNALSSPCNCAGQVTARAKIFSPTDFARRSAAAALPSRLEHFRLTGQNEARWFAEEVQTHEPVLRAYLHRKFPTLHDVDDLVQESYLRLMRAKVRGSLRSAKGFLFTAARNAAFDIFRRRKTASLDAIVEFDELDVLEYKPGVAEIVSRDEELALLAEAPATGEPRPARL